ncbi:hypothetical protein [Nocardia noduli]|uniref:hypothetical protein n=1 Tax=Nocardia noduli TaxID=2815722 RepID=UPI001C244163|nr:hypothetical protein [Nocardia noduli]
MTNPATASTDDLRALLTAGSTLAGNDFHAAAIGLLDFAGLLDRSRVRAHIEVGDLAEDDDTGEVVTARIDWAGLAHADDLGPLSSTEYRLLRLAVSIARGGIGVELNEALRDLGDAHSRAVLHAVAVALGLGEDVEITDSAAYIARKQRHDDRLAALLGERATELS